ncbi:MAG TPA: DMT family transporter [Pirellulales bacterium]|nr:DMT family transporter [Pirellulales bacterium]
MPYVLFSLLCFIWGSSFILMKKATLAFSPLGVSAGRVLGGAAVLAAVWLVQRGAWPLRRKDAGAVLFVVLAGFAWPYMLQPWLVARHGSGFIGTTVSFVPLLTIAASIPVLSVYPTPRQLIGVLGGLFCMGLLTKDGMDRQIPPEELLLALSVPACYALTNVCIRRQLQHVPSLPLSAVTLSVAAVLLLPPALWGEHPDPVASGALPLAVASLALLGVVGTGIGMFIFNKMVLDQGPLFAGMVTYLVPVGALIWGWVDEEQVTLLQFVALAGVFAMVALVQFGAVGRTSRAPMERGVRSASEPHSGAETATKEKTGPTS